MKTQKSWLLLSVLFFHWPWTQNVRLVLGFLESKLSLLSPQSVTLSIVSSLTGFNSYGFENCCVEAVHWWWGQQIEKWRFVRTGSARLKPWVALRLSRAHTMSLDSHQVLASFLAGRQTKAYWPFPTIMLSLWRCQFCKKNSTVGQLSNYDFIKFPHAYPQVIGGLVRWRGRPRGRPWWEAIHSLEQRHYRIQD